MGEVVCMDTAENRGPTRGCVEECAHYPPLVGGCKVLASGRTVLFMCANGREERDLLAGRVDPRL